MRERVRGSDEKRGVVRHTGDQRERRDERDAMRPPASRRRFGTASKEDESGTVTRAAGAPHLRVALVLKRAVVEKLEKRHEPRERRRRRRRGAATASAAAAVPALDETHLPEHRACQRVERALAPTQATQAQATQARFLFHSQRDRIGRNGASGDGPPARCDAPASERSGAREMGQGETALEADPSSGCREGMRGATLETPMPLGRSP